ncbi:MAG: tRNA (adenosine(37)-N6)-dimethylallyltransferase MiaA [Prevotellaceae bacterium]|jgi:tRNA dimethylallyltransferase|nr:tRNA (adenosine(37)-N6)-dimethylallyltransferase MiaA [Prevotellaceae bacterium]
MAKRLKILLGPTGVGKTTFGTTLAKRIGAPILSCDSRQIYREMPIGTAAPTLEEQDGVPHYFVGSHSIHDHYTAGLFELEALTLLEKLFQSYDEVLMVGGSGLYIDAVCWGMDDFPLADLALREHLTQRLALEGIESLCFELKRLDPKSYDQIDIRNKQRVIRALEVSLQTGRPFSSFKSNTHKERPFEIVKEGIMRDRSELYARIDLRVERMMELGLLEEVRVLLPYKNLPALQTVGYKELFDFFEKKISIEEAITLIKRNSRRFAKRQNAYWRRDFSIKWINM